MKLARMPQSHHLHPLLDLPQRIPADWFKLFIVRNIAAEGEQDRVIRFQVLTAEDADRVSQQRGNKSPRRGRPRIFAECDHCGNWISCGRFNQHYNSHEQSSPDGEARVRTAYRAGVPHAPTPTTEEAQ